MGRREIGLPDTELEVFVTGILALCFVSFGLGLYFGRGPIGSLRVPLGREFFSLLSLLSLLVVSENLQLVVQRVVSIEFVK